MDANNNAEKTNKEKMVRVNFYIPKLLKEYLETESSKTGVPQSTLITIALKTYMDQQRSLEYVPKMLSVLGALDPEKISSDDAEKILKSLINVFEK